MKRLVVTAMAGVLVAASLAGCGKKSEATTAPSIEVKQEGQPVVDQPVNFKAVGYGEPGGGEWNDFQCFKDIAKETNINVDYETISGDGADEKLNLILASKNLPDMLFSGLSDGKILSYAQKGILRPLEDLIDQYAPNIKKELDENPNIRKAITSPDGHIYSIPTINQDINPVETTSLNINKTWLDKLGLQVPTTTDEFEAVLKAFKTEDPNGNGQADEIPFTYNAPPPYNVWNGDTGMSGAFGVTDSSSYMMRQGDKLVFTPTTEGYKDYVKWTAKLYGEGLIDQEIFTQDQNQYMSKINSGKVGAYLTNGPVKTPDADYIAIAPLKGPNGDQLWSSVDFSIDKNRGVITTACKYPEAAMRYIDTFYEPLNTLKLRYGKNLEPQGDKFVVLPSKPGEKPMAPGAYVATCESPEVAAQYLIDTEDGKKAKEIKKMYSQYLAAPVPLLNFTPDESKQLSTLSTDLSTIVNQDKAKWTTNQADIDKDWDGYIKSLNNVGLDKYVEIYNTAMQRFLQD